jgi:tRNA(Ile)-lysidine synthase TilS/MesJ
MIINLVRGTGWRGLCALTEQTDIIRPLLAISKAEIISYALDNDLEWREDSTNENVTYLRNYIRLRYVQRMNVDDRHQWVTLYHSQVRLRDEIDAETSSLLPDIRTTHGYSRYKLIMAGRDVFAQLIQSALQTRLERTTIDQLWHFVCTARPEKQFVQAGINFRATTRDLIVSTSDIC